MSFRLRYIEIRNVTLETSGHAPCVALHPCFRSIQSKANASNAEKTRDDNWTCFDDHAALLFPSFAPSALAVGARDVLEDTESELEAEVETTLETDGVLLDVMMEPVTTGAVVVAGLVADEGKGAVVIGGTGVILDVSEATEVDDVSTVPPVMLNVGLMLPESPKTGNNIQMSMQRTR